jgi:hypothetical protein
MSQLTLISSSDVPPATSQRRWVLSLAQRLLSIAAALFVSIAIAGPDVGNSYMYRVVNCWNGEAVGQLRYEVTAASTQEFLVVSVTPDSSALGVPRTEIYAAEGQWLRHTLDNHGIATDHEFSPALPVISTPATGQSWSTRVNAKILSENKVRVVRVTGRVSGTERISVPAGEFDTVKIRLDIYAGDPGDFKSETHISETMWYAPSIGRSVRTETKSVWRNLDGCRFGNCSRYGDWTRAELTKVDKAAR